jgi:cobalt-zinc-cadmium efflux system outer membrane protein
MVFDLSARRAMRHQRCGIFFTRVAGAVGLFASLGSAQPQDTLTLERALTRVRQHPSLTALSLEVQARQSQVAQAGVLQNPRLSIEAENFAGTGPLSGVQGLETTARLEQTLELGGKRSLRKEQAKAETRLAESDRALREAELYREVRETFSEALKLQARIHLSARDTVFLREVVDVARRRAQAGGGGVAEEGKLRLVLSQARIEVANNRAQLEVAYQRLAFLMNLPAPDFIGVREPILSALPEWAKVVQDLEKHPDLLRWKSERELRQASLRSTRAQNVPDLDFNAGVRHLNAEGGDWAVVGGVSVPLPIWNRNRGAITGSESRVRGGEQGMEAARRELILEAFAVWNRLRLRTQELQSLREELLPQAIQVKDASRAAYAQGRFGVLELLDGQRTWLELNERYLERVAEYRQDAAKLEALRSASHSLEME